MGGWEKASRVGGWRGGGWPLWRAEVPPGPDAPFAPEHLSARGGGGGGDPFQAKKCKIKAVCVYTCIHIYIYIVS